MRALLQLTIVETKLFLREPMSLFWVLAFPLFWWGFFGYVIGGTIVYEGKEVNYVDFLLPGGICLIIMTAALVSMTTNLASYREQHILKRLRVTPLKTSHFIFSQILTQCIILLLGISLLVGAGIAFFNVRIHGSLASLGLVSLLGMLTFLSFAFIIASFAPAARSANGLAMFVFIPMMFLSEMFLPLSMLPRFLKVLAKSLPATPLTQTLRDIVLGTGTLQSNADNLIILALWLVIGVLLSIKLFKWY